MENISFKNLLCNLSRKAIKEVVKVLASKIILKIYYKSLFQYLIVKKVVKNSGVELKVGFRTGLELEGPSNLSISLSTREKALDIAFERLKRAVEAKFL